MTDTATPTQHAIDMLLLELRIYVGAPDELAILQATQQAIQERIAAIGAARTKPPYGGEGSEE